MDQKNLLQNSIRNKIPEKIKRIKETRPFHLSLNTDYNGMIKCHIDGWMHIDEAKILWNSIQSYNNCLELGTYQGLTTWLLGQANPDCQLTTVEIFEHNTNIAKENCRKYKHIEFVTADSNTWLEQRPKKFDWVFVDHSHEGFYMDQTIALLKKCLHDDHVVLLHDMHLPGVQQQADKFSSFTRIRNLGIGTLW